MEKTEPTFVPEWLKNSGSLTTTSHQSSLQSDDQSASVSQRRKLLISGNDNDLQRATTSSYFRRPSSSNGSSRLRSYSSFGRRDWDKNKEKHENRYRDSDPLGNILPSRFEKDGLRRSQSNLSAKRGESWSRKVINEKNGHNNNNRKITFERDFPSLGLEEKQVNSEIGRVPSPGLSSVIQNLPVGSSGVIGGDSWTSALAEVPVMVGTNGPGSVSVTANVAPGRNMAETLAHGPPRVQTAPQLTGTQRLEELAVKQSRQLIPVTPSMPKALALNSDKPKLKVGQLQHQSSHIVNHSPSTRPVSANADVTKSSSLSSSSLSSVGKLHVLKPSRERNGSTIAKESSSPTSGGKLPESPLNERKPPCVSTTLEKKPSPQAKSRNDFFNLMRKKSMANNNSPSPAAPPESANDNKASESGDAVQPLGESKVDVSINNNNIAPEKFTKNGKSRSGCDVILYSEEEEARFLKSLGWEETTEEEGLTEEEINSFYRDVSKYVNLKTASSFFKGTQLKSLMPLNLLMGKNGSDAKVDS